jgi:sigma-E factor negative regulatory protein RseC
MIEQRGQVTGLDGEHAWVRIGGQSGCPACDAGEGCGAGLFGRLLNRSEARIRVKNEARARPGEAVVLGIDEGAYLSLVLRLYGLPLVAGLAGAMLAVYLLGPRFGDALLARDLLTALGGILSAAVALAVSHRHLPQRFTRLSPRMLNTDSTLDCAGSDRNSSGQDTN